MSAGEEDSWPSFELTTFDPKESLRLPSEISEVLYEAGVPKDLFSGRYSVADCLTEVDIPGRGRGIQFGTTNQADALCVDLATSEVVEVPKTGGRPLLVNSSLPAFARTVQAVLERFPYYGRDVEVDELEAASEELGEMIRAIDLAAMIPDRFWSTFVDDVMMGVFATEDVLADWP